MILTEDIKKQLDKLWFIYGNGGKHHTLGNHRLIQDLLQNKIDSDVTAQFNSDIKFFSKSKNVNFRVTSECIEIIKQNFNPTQK